MEKDAKKAAKLEQKVNMLTAGYVTRAEKSKVELEAVFEQVRLDQPPRPHTQKSHGPPCQHVNEPESTHSWLRAGVSSSPSTRPHSRAAPSFRCNLTKALPPGAFGDPNIRWRTLRASVRPTRDSVFERRT
eukprot:5805489-Pyramimonas_sp.AAC.2